MAKTFVTSCCGKKIEDCPGCQQGMELIPKEEKTMKEATHPIFRKIDEGTVTVNDFNQLIAEATPESVRDRLRRKVKRNETDSHIDDEGHQKLKLPTFASRVQPKRKRANNTQMHGQGKAAHRRSTRTQKRQQQNAKQQNAIGECKKFDLRFDKAGYANNVHDMLQKRGYKTGKDYSLDGSILTVSEDLKFDNDLKKFLLAFDAKRIDVDMPDIFEYKGDKNARK